MTERLSSEEQELLEERLLQAASVTAPPATIPRRNSAEPAPLSFAQTRLWFFDQLLPGSPLYNISFTARLRFALDPRVFKQALRHVVGRHEVLRTVFAVDGEEPVQVVRPDVDVPISAYDLRPLPPARREEQLSRLVARFQDEAFDLTRGPLLRVMLSRLGPSDYLLVVGVHHIAADGWSLGVLAHELETAYAAIARGREPPLDPLGIQYSDFSAWQRSWLTGEILDRELAYWRERLAGLPVLDLPTDRPRPPLQAHRGSDLSFTVPASLVERLSRIGRDSGATLFMVALACFDLVLARWAGQEDVVVGAPIAGRSRPEVEPLIGFFVNTLVLRVDLSGNPTFAELLQRVRATALEAYAHQELPFEKLVEELHPERDLARNPLVQVIFQLFEAASPDVRALETGLRLPTRTSLFDLRVDLAPGSDGLSGRIEYDLDLFEHVTIERLAQRFLRLLEQVAESPDRPIGSYELVTPEEHRLLEEWNATAAPIPDLCVHELFARQAGLTPDAVAVIDGEGKQTFAALETRSNQLAHRLRMLGVGPGTVVGICLPRNALLPTALLAVLKAGAAFLPLEPAEPAARLAFFVEDSDAAVVLTTGSLRGRVPAGPVAVELDGEWPHDSPELPPAEEVALEAPAWLLYTSGSTGPPKGVLGSHLGLVNRLAWGLEESPFAPDDVCCAKTRLSFVDSLCELFGPLVGGAPLVIADEAELADPRALAELIAREGVTRLVAVPSLLSALVDVAPDVVRSSRLRSLTSSGEALSGELAGRLLALLPGCRLLNVYGSTEMTADATAQIVRSGPAGPAPIGRPLANVRVLVLGPARELLPVGAVGELYVGGAGLALGYVGHAAAGEQERFVADPFSPGKRLYRTGDLARWRLDRELEFVGRVDRQLKVRGVRVEPEEVELVLHSHEVVRDAAVVARPGIDGPELCAFVVLEQPEARIDAVRAFLHGHLSEQSVPTHIVPLDELPRLSNGKVDRGALARRSETSPHSSVYEAPSTPIEQAVAEVFAELSRAERVGRRDDFFALGGHSLLATRAAARLSDRFKKTIPLRLVFEHATVAELAEAIAEIVAAPGEEPVPIVRVERERYRAPEASR
ncbi:MAG TPA: amino acid adenylation domain-containing protein [Gaiellaceae bacterium]